VTKAKAIRDLEREYRRRLERYVLHGPSPPTSQRFVA
jgi:hypothetical protein